MVTPSEPSVAQESLRSHGGLLAAIIAGDCMHAVELDGDDGSTI